MPDDIVPVYEYQKGVTPKGSPCWLLMSSSPSLDIPKEVAYVVYPTSKDRDAAEPVIKLMARAQLLHGVIKTAAADMETALTYLRTHAADDEGLMIADVLQSQVNNAKTILERLR